MSWINGKQVKIIGGYLQSVVTFFETIVNTQRYLRLREMNNFELSNGYTSLISQKTCGLFRKWCNKYRY